MMQDKSIRLTDKKTFQENLEFIKNFGYTSYIEGNFFAENSTNANLPISLYDNLNSKLEIVDNITWLYEKNVWWCCENGHVFLDKPVSFIRDHTQSHWKRQKPRILFRDLICLICVACDMSSSNILFFWDDENQQYHSSNQNIIFSRIVISENQIPYWLCDTCETYIEIIDRKKKIEKMNYKIQYLNELLGICYFCNTGKLISGYNDVYSNFPDLSFRWDTSEMPYSIHETKFNLENRSMKYSFICPNGHKWKNNLENELRKFCYCGEPIVESIFYALRNMGLRKIFSEYSSGLEEYPTDEWGLPLPPKLPVRLKKLSSISATPKESLDVNQNIETEKLNQILDDIFDFGEIKIDNNNISKKFEPPPRNLNYENMFFNLHVQHNWICSKNKTHIWKTTLFQRIKNPRCPKCVRWITESEFLELFNELTEYNFINGKMKANWGKKQMIQIDILDNQGNIAIDYDGYDAHSENIRHKKTWMERIERDTLASHAVLSAPVEEGKPSFIMIRIREKDARKGPLPELLIKHSNYFEIEYESKSDKRIIVEQVSDKILEIRSTNDS